GGRTGLIVHNVKGVGKGDNFQLIDLYEVDVALLREMRECERQAAQEVGQWVEKVAPTNPDGTDAYDPGDFTADETLALLQGLVAGLGLTDARTGEGDS